jgi:general stress protein CsbA
MLVPSGGGIIPQKTSSAFFDLVSISAHRCSSFFAEAAVLVLVLALLDRFMLKGHLEPRWVISAVILSLMLLAASIATDLSARRWLQRH